MNEIKAHNTMSPESQQIAIAEACGFEVTRIEYDGDGKIYQVWALTPDSWAGKDVRPWLPDFNDLNACHQFEKILIALGPPALDTYELFLFAICTRAGNRIFRATAAQRCEAFLRTINKWTNN